MLLVFSAFITALLLSIVVTPVVILAANRFNIVDDPNPGKRGEVDRHQKIHLLPTPRVGGAAMILAFILTGIIWYPFDVARTLLGGSFLLFTLGFLDDLHPIRAIYRLTIQVSVSLLFVVYTGVSIEKLSIFGYVLDLGFYLGTAFSTFILVGSVNSLNMLDGMDGLAGGLATISIVMLAYLYNMISGSAQLVLFIGITTVGATLGFLRYNSHPAKIFMGDGGSNWLGFIMGFMLIMTIGGIHFDADGRAISHGSLIPIVSCLLCVAIPVADTCFVVISRVLSGKSPFRADNNHLHHIMNKLGLGQKKTVTLIYFMAIMLSTAGIIPIAYPLYGLDFIPYLVTLVFVASFAVLKNKTAFTFIKRMISTAIRYRQSQVKGKFKKVFVYWLILNKYSVYSIIAITPFFAGEVPNVIGMVALYAIPIIIIFGLVPIKKNDFTPALILSLSSALILTAINTNVLRIELAGQRVAIHYLYNMFFIFLGISSITYFIVTFNRNYMSIGPSDFLLVLLPLVLILVPEPWQTEYRLRAISIKYFILFISLRTFVFGDLSTIRRIRAIVLFTLIYIALNGVYGLKVVY